MVEDVEQGMDVLPGRGGSPPASRSPERGQSEPSDGEVLDVPEFMPKQT